MRKMKVAVIGCGNIGKSAHIPSYMNNETVEIKYFCDILPERAQAMVDQYHVGTAITDYHEALADPEVEAVSVCVPNKYHSVIAIDALDAGKNVLCEKPAARNYQEAVQMQQAQKRSGKVLNIGVVNRFNTSVNLIKKMIDAGELGEVYHVYLSFRAPRSIPGMGGWFTTKELSGGGALIDWGVHFLDLAMYCMGDPQPKTVSAEAYCKLGKNMHEYAYTSMWSRDVPDFDGTYDVDDFVTGMIRTEGPTITLNGAWAQNVNVNEMYIDFLGDKAGIRLQYGGKFSVYTSKDGVLYEIHPDYKMENMFQKEIDAFVDCIRSGEKLTAHIDTVLITAKIMQAMYDSSDAHREIQFQ